MESFSFDSGYIGLIFETIFQNKEILYDLLEAAFLNVGTAGQGHNQQYNNSKGCYILSTYYVLEIGINVLPTYCIYFFLNTRDMDYKWKFMTSKHCG